MALLKCEACGYLREVANQHLGKKVKCPSCQQVTSIQDTVALVQQLAQQLTQSTAELMELKATLPPPPSPKGEKGYAFANLPSSPALNNFDGVIQWFAAKQVKVNYDKKAVDISGFFDEVAVMLGDNYDILKAVSDKIKWTQAKGYTKASFNLASHSQQDIQIIKAFCQELYNNAFIAKYFQEKTDKRVHLTLQTEPKIVNFFNGEWLEWFVFMKVASWLVDKQFKFSCLRSFHLDLPNGDKHEIDLFFLINDKIPLWIECKAGEFRSFINKYAELCKRLKFDKKYFLLLALGTPDDKISGLTSTFNMKIVNEKNFLAVIAELLEPRKQSAFTRLFDRFNAK
jgi:phage FluMu protein Com